MKYLDEASRAARDAGAVIRSYFGRTFEVKTKGSHDLVTEVDTAAEQVIRSRLLGAFPAHAFLGEESGLTGEENAPTWVVDPLDGTRNFVHGYPLVAVSIALVEQGRATVGVVYDPLRDELFTATREDISRLNGEPIEVSPCERLEQSLLVTGFSRTKERQFDCFRHLNRLSGGVRRDGCAALDLCYVAAGRLDAFWEWALSPWDIAAGSLLVERAQGCVTSLTGSPLELFSGQILATNTYLHRAMVEALR